MILQRRNAPFLESGHIAPRAEQFIIDNPRFAALRADALLHIGMHEQVGVHQLLFELAVGQHLAHDRVVATILGV